MIGVGSANLALLSPEAEVVLSGRLVFTLRYLALWRVSDMDGVYQVDVRKMVREADSSGEKLGKAATHGYIAELLYTPNKHISVWIYYGYLFAGEYIQNTGTGENMEAFSLRASYKF
jgi:hypothetical protein